MSYISSISAKHYNVKFISNIHNCSTSHDIGRLKRTVVMVTMVAADMVIVTVMIKSEHLKEGSLTYLLNIVSV
jgi:hypothetical protein